MFSFLDDVSTHECHGTLGESLFENRPFRNRPSWTTRWRARINGGGGEEGRGDRLTDKPDGGETLIDSYWLAT